MALILGIESSTKNCSVAIGRNGKLLSLRNEASNQYVHSEKLHHFIKECLEESKLKVEELDAIAVGKGPGSYTGLRIGTSAAKGFCFALNIPMIAVSSVELLATAVLQKEIVKEDDLIMPMIDARRMEVYTAAFNSSGKLIEDISAQIIDSTSFENYEARKIWLAGDGAAKALDVLKNEKFGMSGIEFPSADILIQIAEEKFLRNEFEDIAYFEPFYLKEFIAGKPKKVL